MSQAGLMPLEYAKNHEVRNCALRVVERIKQELLAMHFLTFHRVEALYVSLICTLCVLEIARQSRCICNNTQLNNSVAECYCDLRRKPSVRVHQLVLVHG